MQLSFKLNSKLKLLSFKNITKNTYFLTIILISTRTRGKFSMYLAFCTEVFCSMIINKPTSFIWQTHSVNKSIHCRNVVFQNVTNGLTIFLLIPITLGAGGTLPNFIKTKWNWSVLILLFCRKPYNKLIWIFLSNFS